MSAGKGRAAEPERLGGRCAPEGGLPSFGDRNSLTPEGQRGQASRESSGQGPQPAHSQGRPLGSPARAATLSESRLRQNGFWKTFIAFGLQVEALTDRTERLVHRHS